MRTWSLAIGAVLAGVVAAAAADPPLVCFGNEPSWGLALERPGEARLILFDEPPAEYRGADTHIPHLRERAWRGKREDGQGSDLVAFLRQADCSDGMSDVTHPVVARVSLPDGRFLAGCCRLVASGAEASPAAGAALEGPLWRLTHLRGQDAQALAGLPTGITVRFEAGQVQGFGGCNQFAGGYTTEGDRLTLPPLAGTMMACAPPLMAIETAFMGAFAGALRYTVAEGRLTLTTDAETDPKLVFVAAPPPRLEGIAWEVTGFNNGRQAVVSPLAGTTLTVSFQAGSVDGAAGCNRFRATYTREGNRLTVGPAATTRMQCGGEGVMEQERQFLAALESATTWAIDRDMLDLHRADGERVLLARRGVK
ncbi:MAG: heat shock protein [Anaeromyxobacteraceae bacterium]|jgi:heat shock protein HslJ|nr:heat shock protein [Anaeromyxobacteraceae bacterium]